MGLEIEGERFDAIGNRFLLYAPWKEAVRISSRISEKEIKLQVEHYLKLAYEGAVLVSPAISQGEKAVMREALDNNFPVIFISARQFIVFSKTGTQFHSACAAGMFLSISFPDHTDRSNILTREKCLVLNGLASRIARI